MAYIYLDDGGPEANEYDSNYVYFNENNPKSWEIVWNFMKKKNRDRSELLDELKNDIDECLQNNLVNNYKCA